MTFIGTMNRRRIAEAAVERFRIIVPGVTAGSCVKATGPTQRLLGTSDELDHVSGEPVDHSVGPVSKVTLGGAVADGDWLTSDANGRAVATTTTGHQVIGRAEEAGVANQEIYYLWSPGQL